VLFPTGWGAGVRGDMSGCGSEEGGEGSGRGPIALPPLPPTATPLPPPLPLPTPPGGVGGVGVVVSSTLDPTVADLCLTIEGSD